MSKDRIFIDTSGFYALLVSNDIHHHKAVKVLKELTSKSCEFITTDYILDESVTLLRARRVTGQIARLFEIVDDSSYVSLEWVGPERFERARMYFAQYTEHDFSFTDCTSFVLMRELGIHSALTGDKHFNEAGFTAILRPDTVLS